ncbi:hypothetical protein A4R35_09560 [Thermogemmatispora tikiterensis]|uniref:Uncharacterized protein n=1 Tax=Thermogemmatispora tikiterensis TaxID=1825093 RepID=A0A328VG17_9CHLR|nr:hypothetical protein A4R35_09560 [Thermogemmatispora tikiterensis]
MRRFSAELPCGRPTHEVTSGSPLLGLLRAAEEDLLPPSLQQLLARFGLSYATVRPSLSEECFSI